MKFANPKNPGVDPGNVRVNPGPGLIPRQGEVGGVGRP